MTDWKYSSEEEMTEEDWEDLMAAMEGAADRKMDQLRDQEAEDD